MRKMTAMLAACVLFVVLGTAAYALINPTFTPVDLIRRADQILLLKISKADDKDRCAVEVVRCLKGKAPDKAQVIDIGKSENKEHAKAVKEIIGELGDGPALLFVGKGEKNEPVFLLHLCGKWVAMDRPETADTWLVGAISSYMDATWAGGTDMLLKIAEMIIKHPEISVPVAVGASWDEHVKIGKVEGKVRAALAVDIAGKGENALFVASAGGDKVFTWDAKAKKLQEVTAKLKLGSKSARAAWGDFNGDGRLDLASSDGKALALWLQAADGSFAATPVPEVPKDACVGLGALEVGVKGRAGLLWSSAGAPVALMPDREKDGVFTQKPLALGAAKLKEPGAAGQCLVADFDGDVVADVVQPFAKGAFFFKGKGNGEFAEAVVTAVDLGQGQANAWLGDWDMDGRIDIFTVAEDSCRLWQNEGGGKFSYVFGTCGEITYISRPGGLGGNACDINGDGLQDIFITYPEMGPLFFFNRGFRSFGHAHRPIDLAETGILEEALVGQQAGVCADFNDDGGQDMVLVLTDGNTWFFPRIVDDAVALVARVALPPGGPSAGPVTVTGESAIGGNDRRSLGAWVVTPGTGEAFFSRTEAGDVTFSWKLPGGEIQNKTVTLELSKKPKRFVIGAKK